MGVSKPEAKLRLEKWTKDAYRAVTQSCSKRYPQLSKWVLEWEAAFLHLVVTCAPLATADFGAEAVSCQRPGQITHRMSPESKLYCLFYAN